jgi:hypothetical protein
MSAVIIHHSSVHPRHPQHFSAGCGHTRPSICSLSIGLNGFGGAAGLVWLKKVLGAAKAGPWPTGALLPAKAAGFEESAVSEPDIVAAMLLWMEPHGGESPEKGKDQYGESA